MRLAIITARGGSKRIPNKNIKNFCGRPILAYSIEAAKESGLFDVIMVSTDSEEIAKIACQYGADVPFFRSAETSGDYATTAQVLVEVLEEYHKRGKEFDTVCCVYPTAPFVTAEKLQKAVMLMEESHAGGVMPVVRFSYPPQRALLMEKGTIHYQYPQFENSRSQDLQAIYHDCGQFYVCQATLLQKFVSLVVPNTLGLVMPETEVQDIDNLSDWELAEMKYRLMKEKYKR